MSRSRLWRSHSTDDFLNRTLNSYPSVAGDNSYLPSSFDYSDSLDYDQGFQSRDDRRSSQYSGYDERPTSRCQSHPMKERRVTWAPFPESSSNRDRLLSTLERRMAMRIEETQPIEAQAGITQITVLITRGPPNQASTIYVLQLGTLHRATIPACMVQPNLEVLEIISDPQLALA
ncbi:hypothetical protein PSTT_09221 [Puccinia striiformis]|uniref:Uncharacterized protein n=1 Tax=Puccinia striiformis TaxID=27350 RepID=A0A2S4V9A3_9BASI|nr:hypothetical protein PSTT_09221 [Puccinia striiformis]